MLTAQQQARCRYKWYTWIRTFWHLTDRILTLFHLPFPISTIRSYLSLTSFAVFQWNWGTFFYKQTGRLDLNLNKTLLGNAAGCVHCEKYQGDWSLSWTQVISAGTFCLELISALELLVTHGLSASWIFFSIHLPFLFLQTDMTFSKQVLIKHFVSATEMGTLSLKNS